MGVVVRGFLALFFILLLAMQVRAGADQSTARGGDVCILKHKDFCGNWAPSSSRAPKIIMMITGGTLTWDNGDHAQCVLVDEGEEGGNLYFAVRCRLTFFDNSIEDPSFILFHMQRGGDQMHMVYGQSTECMIAGWELMVESGGKYMKDSKPECGGFSREPYYKYKS